MEADDFAEIKRVFEETEAYFEEREITGQIRNPPEPVASSSHSREPGTRATGAALERSTIDLEVSRDRDDRSSSNRAGS